MSNRKLYETTFIVNAALEDADIHTIVNRVQSFIEDKGGEIVEINHWGRRRLAYPINKKFNGYYVYIAFNAVPSTIPQMERFMILDDGIMRHLTMVLSQKLRTFRIERAAAKQLLAEKEASEAASADVVVTNETSSITE